VRAVSLFLAQSQACSQWVLDSVDDVVLLATSYCDLQHALGQFAAEWESVGMRVSTFKSEAMVLCWKTEECSLRVGRELLPQAKEFKYLKVLFRSEGKMEREMNRI